MRAARGPATLPALLTPHRSSRALSGKQFCETVYWHGRCSLQLAAAATKKKEREKIEDAALISLEKAVITQACSAQMIGTHPMPLSALDAIAATVRPRLDQRLPLLHRLWALVMLRAPADNVSAKEREARRHEASQHLGMAALRIVDLKGSAAEAQALLERSVEVEPTNAEMLYALSVMVANDASSSAEKLRLAAQRLQVLARSPEVPAELRQNAQKLLQRIRV